MTSLAVMLTLVVSQQLAAVPEAQAYPPTSPIINSYLGAAQTWNTNCTTLYTATMDNLTSLDVSKFPTVSSSVITSHGTNGTTIALGPNANGSMSMYFWSYGGRSVTEVPSGTQNGYRFSLPQKLPNSGDAWAGGEVDQTTGNIYAGSAATDTLGDGGYRIVVFNPTSGNWMTSGRIEPQTPSDEIPSSSGANSVASDMALDANGNAYIVVGSPIQGHYLLRVVPGSRTLDKTRHSDWKYNKVVKLASGLPTASDFNGMSFFNGMLYMLDLDGTVFQVNPLTGAVTQSSNKIPYGQHDLSACQVAPVLQGTVYRDLNSDGIIQTSEESYTLPNATVQLYDNNKNLIGSQQTSASGTYSFLLPATSGDFYVRLVRPTLNSIEGRQSYASQTTLVSGPNGKNGVTPYCMDQNGNSNPRSSSGYCYGAQFGSDPSGTVSDVTAQANSYSKVTMTTSRNVADADFGVSFGVNGGDAPDGYRTSTNSGGPRHVVVNPNGTRSDVPYVKLGSKLDTVTPTPSTDASSDPNDDGVFVAKADGSNEVPLQKATLVPGSSYRFRAHVSTNVPNSKVWVSGWMGNWTASSATASWNTTAVIMNGLHPDANGDVIVNYTPTAGSLSAMINTFARFRVTLSNSNPALTPAHVAATDTTDFASIGEVEDYAVTLVNGMVRLGVKTIGEGAGPFQLTGTNLAASGVSYSQTADLQTPAGGQVVMDSRLHAFSANGTKVDVSTTKSPTGKTWTISSVDCGSVTPESLSKTGFTIPATAIVAGADITCVATYVSGPDPASSTLTVDQNNQPADGVARDKVTAHVLAADGTTPIWGATVKFVVAEPGQTTQSDKVVTDPPVSSGVSTCVTDAKGECSVEVMSSYAADFDVIGKVTTSSGDVELSNSPVSITFVRATPDPDNSSYWVEPAPPATVPVGTGTGYVYIDLKSGTNTAITGYDLDKLLWRADSSLGTKPNGSAFEAVTGTPGRYRAPIQSTVSGEKTISVRFGDTEWTDAVAVTLGQHNDKISFKEGAPDLESSEYYVSTGAVGLLGQGSHTVTAVIRDAYGNGVPGWDAYLSASSADSLGSGNITGFIPSSDGTGVYQATITSSLPGDKAITAKIDIDQDSGTPAVNVPVGKNADESAKNTVAVFSKSPADHGFYSVTTGTQTVNTGKHTVTVRLQDYLDNPVDGSAGLVWGWIEGSPAQVSVGAFSETAADGSYTATVNSSRSGNFTVKVGLGSNLAEAQSHPLAVDSTLNSGNIIARFGSSLEMGPSSYFEVSSGVKTVGDSEWHTVTAHLFDADDNPIIGQEGKLEGSTAPTLRGQGDTTIGRVSGFTESSTLPGVYTARVYSTSAGDKAISVDYSGGSAKAELSHSNGASILNNTATFRAGAVDLANSYYSVPSGSVLAGTAAAVHAYLYDRYANGVPGQAAILGLPYTSDDISSGGNTGRGEAFNEVSSEPGHYLGGLLSYRTGPKTVKVKFDQTELDYQANRVATFTAAGVCTNCTGTYFQVSTGSQPVSTGTHTVTIFTVDVYGNPVPGQAGAFEWVPSDLDNPSNLKPLGSQPVTSFRNGTQDGSYQADIKSDISGKKGIGVNLIGETSIPLGARGNNTVAEFEAGEVAKSWYWVDTASHVVMESTSWVRVRLQDANGNAVTGKAG
ncbi:MAG: Ig-like domain-containing protein, partial [Propionibacteriaceae bacterium]|nr:Ig-like domain-containing protein [Propionibacteriaceae bacterium]